MRCRVEGCEREVEAHGWCQAHYFRWRRNGDVKAETPIGHFRGVSADDNETSTREDEVSYMQTSSPNEGEHQRECVIQLKAERTVWASRLRPVFPEMNGAAPPGLDKWLPFETLLSAPVGPRCQIQVRWSGELSLRSIDQTVRMLNLYREDFANETEETVQNKQAPLHQRDRSSANAQKIQRARRERSRLLRVQALRRMASH